jgi:hypothetical protein
MRQTLPRFANVRLCLRFAVRHDERECENGRIVLRRAARIADLNDAVHDANTICLDAADERVVVLLHEIAFADVIRAAFSAEDQEAIEPRPVIDLPRVTVVGVANLARARDRLRLRRNTAVEKLCVINGHISPLCLQESR